MNELFHVRISGPLACFTRPEFSTERVSYEIITPSAARGILEAILWKPAIRWEVRRIRVLRPVKWIEFQRNEVNSRVPSRMAAFAARMNEPLRNFYASEDRAQRNTVALREVDYSVEAQIHLTPHAGSGEGLIKFREMFLRRMDKGQHYYQPYLGCREFPAWVEPAHPDLQPIADSRDLGWMLHDLDFGSEIRARFFHAQMIQGIIEVPAWMTQGGAA